MNRRRFLQDAGLAIAGLTVWPEISMAQGSSTGPSLTILHTNDVHSRLDPFPANAGNLAGMGGASRRAALINQVRSTEEYVLLLDAGDMLQGTPYFNFFDGVPEFRTMDAMRYDAATLGNHDFDGGLGLLKRRLPEVGFAVLSANYSFSEPSLAGLIQPWKVFERGPLRIGVYGIGIQLEGLVPSALTEGTEYLDPVRTALETGALLRHDLGCHLVVCLSHLGHAYRDQRISDLQLASRIRDTDLIIGGHTHTLLDKPVIVPDMDGQPVRIAQVGWGGAWLGRIDIQFSRTLKWKHMSGRLHPVSNY